MTDRRSVQLPNFDDRVLQRGPRKGVLRKRYSTYSLFIYLLLHRSANITVLRGRRNYEPLKIVIFVKSPFVKAEFAEATQDRNTVWYFQDYFSVANAEN